MIAAPATDAAARQARPPACLPGTFSGGPATVRARAERRGDSPRVPSLARLLAGRGAALSLVVSRLRRRSLSTPIRPLPAQHRAAHTSISGQ